MRHRLAGLSFLAAVVAPTLGAGAYLYTVAVDQHASTMEFSGRSSEESAPIEFPGALTQAFGGAGPDAEIDHAFIRSQQMVESAPAAPPLREVHNRPADDRVLHLGEERLIEDVLDYWRRMAAVPFDAAKGVVNLNARAFDPESARRIAGFVLDEATKTYVAALAPFERVQAEARRQMRALALDIRPTLSVELRFPQRPVIASAVLAGLSARWAAVAPIVHNIRDPR